MGLRALGRLPSVHVETDFLDPEDHAELLADSLARKSEYAPSSVTVFGEDEVLRARVNSATRIAGSRKLGKSARAAIERAVLARQQRIAQATGVTFPTDRGFELEAVHSGDGAFFGPHVDTVRSMRTSHRVISAVYYYSRNPAGFTGGELRLWSLDRTQSTTIEPRDNSMVFFPSIVPHEVMPVKVPSGVFADGRFSVNCWIHRKL